MAVLTLGTTTTTALNAITFNPAQGVGVPAAGSLLSASDLAAIANSITGDDRFAASNPTGILATGTTNGTATISTLAATGGGPLASILVGMLVLGVGIAPGTFVVGKPNSTSVTLSQAATGSASGVRLAFIPAGGTLTRLSFNGQLEIPRRGVVKVFPGDVVAIDNTGWPILLSAAAVAYAGSLWDLS